MFMNPSWGGGGDISERPRASPQEGRNSHFGGPGQLEECQGEPEGRSEFSFVAQNPALLSEDGLRRGLGDLAEGGDSCEKSLLRCSYFHSFSRRLLRIPRADGMAFDVSSLA